VPSTGNRSPNKTPYTRYTFCSVFNLFLRKRVRKLESEWTTEVFKSA
jgi:hypothetical protein